MMLRYVIVTLDFTAMILRYAVVNLQLSRTSPPTTSECTPRPGPHLTTPSPPMTGRPDLRRRSRKHTYARPEHDVHVPKDHFARPEHEVRIAKHF